MQKRLKEYKYDDSLFATAARSMAKSGELDDAAAAIPEQIAEAARVASRPVLISQTDEQAMTEDEKKIEHEWDDDCIDNHHPDAGNAIDKILGDDHGLELRVFVAFSGYEGDCDDYMDPILFLFHEASCVVDENECRPHAKAHAFSLPVLAKEEETQINANMDKVLHALGLEAEAEPTWQLIVTNSCNPR